VQEVRDLLILEEVSQQQKRPKKSY